MRACVLVAMLAACGRIGFSVTGAPAGGDDGGDGGPVADADPAHAYAGTCTTAATTTLGGTGTVFHLAATIDGIVYGADYSDLESYRFADGQIVLRATTTFPEIDGLAGDPSSDRILVLDSLGPENYTILDRALHGAPLAPLAQLSGSGDFGNVATAAGFGVAGFTAAYDSGFVFTGASTMTTLGPNANSVPAAAVVPGGFLVVTGTGAPACQWRWLDATGAPTGVTHDDAFDCGFPGLFPDDTGAHALLVWTSNGSSLAVRVMDLTSRTWLSSAQSFGSVAQFDVLYVASRGWLVLDNINAMNPTVVLVSTTGAVGSVLFTVPDHTEYARLFDVAGRPYAVWVTGMVLHVQQLCV